jgi:hypothetical protein
MCECGCGEFQPTAKFPAPDGKWYGVEIYASCDTCSTPFGVWVGLLGEHDDADSLPELPIGDGLPRGIPVVDRDKLELWLRFLENADFFAPDEIKEGFTDLVRKTEREWFNSLPAAEKTDD